MMLDKTVVPLSTAADVSSHDDSIAKIYSFISVKRKDKDTKKKIIHSILIIIVILFALLASVCVVVLDGNVQSMLARTVAGFLSDKLDTEVKIKTFYITPDMEIHAEEVLMNDKYHRPMFTVGELKAKLSLRDLANELRIRDVYVKNVTGNIVKYENETSTNIKELFYKHDKKNDDDKKNDFSIKVDKLIVDNGHVIVWNQNKDKPWKESMDYAHIDIDSINANFTDLAYENKIVSAVINHLSGADKSGLTLDTLSTTSKVIVSAKGLDVPNLKLKTHATSLDMDLYFYYNNYKAYNSFVDSVRMFAKIRPSQMTLSDLRYFAPVMDKMKDTLMIEGTFNGFVSDFDLDDFAFEFKDSTNFLGTIRMKGLPKFFDTHINANVQKMNTTYQDLSEFYIPTPTETIPLPQSLDILDKILVSGTYDGFYNKLNDTEFNLHTNIGNIYMKMETKHDNDVDSIFANIYTNNLNIADLLGVDDEFVVTMNSNLKGKGTSIDDADMELAVNVKELKLLNNTYKNLAINADCENKRLILSSNINEKFIKADIDALLDLSKGVPSIDAKLDVEKADLYRLHISDNDKTMLLSTNVVAKLRGNELDKTYGSIIVENTTYKDSRGVYEMDSLNVNITENHFDSKDVSVECDFFDMNINGIINFSKIGNTFKNYVLEYFYVNKWGDKGVKLEDNNQDFYMNLTLKDTETLSRLLMPNLRISNNTNLTATFTSNNYQLYSTLMSDEVSYNDFKFNNIYFRNKTSNDKSTANVTIKEFVIKERTEKNNIKLSLENLNLLLDAHCDSLLFNVLWDDEVTEDRNKANIEASFVAHDEYGGTMKLSSSDIIINDTLWNISPLCMIDFDRNKTYINNLDIYSGNQSIMFDGLFPKKSTDTLYVKFNDFDISNFDLLTKGFGVDPDGVIEGDLQVSGLSDEFTLFSNLDVNDIYINKHLVGNASLDANWNDADTSIYIKTEVVEDSDKKDKVLLLEGKYYTSRKNNNLDFDALFNGVDIALISPFVKNILSRVGGYLKGDFDIVGSFSEPIINGTASLFDAACKINYLNTYYKINPQDSNEENLAPYLRFDKNRIDLNNIVLVDTLGNKALANGVITHDYLKDFIFDIDLALDNFLAMDMPEDVSSTFYATAVADGNVEINGPLDDISITIDAETMQGTTIDIVLTGTNTINDNFIVFVQKDVQKDTTQIIIPEIDKGKKFTLNLNADVNQNTEVDIHLPSNMGNINATGNGNIRMGYAQDQLSLYGDYVIDEGTFVFNFQNLVRRDFNIKPGGTISWTGKAEDADINVVGSYRTKSSISSLGIEIDSTSLVNNINVDCILRLQEKLTNPTITFGIELPNATDDIKNTVFSIIDTTNQAVMSQQIISLLVLGSFSYSNSSLYSIGASNYYNVLTSSLSSWLSQISKDIDVGLRYTPEDNLTSEELEVALSTQLFNDRLTIEGNFGMYTNSNNETQGANNIVGDFDMTFKITNRLSLKAYNHSNLNSNYYSYTYEAYSDYTQGIGISYSQSFDNIREIFARRNRNKKNNTQKSNSRSE